MKLVDHERIPESPYPELRQVVELFASSLAALLGENLVGLYLVGSIALDGFDSDSDVDYLAVIKNEVSGKDVEAIQEINGEIQKLDSYPARHLEGSYICVNDLNDWSVVGEKALLYFDNGSITAERSAQDNKWLTRLVLREHGVVLVGPRPSAIMKKIPAGKVHEETKAGMVQIYGMYTKELDQSTNFWNSRFGQSFFVLTYCRMLHTYRTGGAGSKKEAMTWARRSVDARWLDLIEEAWKEREGVRFGLKVKQRASTEALNRTRDFMEYCINTTE